MCVKVCMMRLYITRFLSSAKTCYLFSPSQKYIKHFSMKNASLREFSITSINRSKPVDLSYFVFQPESQSSSAPIIILHGLLGSKQNWRGLGKAMSVKTKRKVYTLDARNHGDSPHSDDFSYSLMKEDVIHFMSSHDIPKAVLIGHSMGGRTAMHLALTTKDLIDRLIIVDVSPFTLPHESSLSFGYMKIMEDALSSLQPMSLVQARKVIDDYLTKKIPELPIRQFLLTNLTEKEKTVVWKPNLKAVLKSFEAGIVKFPMTPGYYPDETLFICGGNSPFVPLEEHSNIKTLFPKAEFIEIPDAGHWVHSDKPTEFLQAVYDFL